VRWTFTPALKRRRPFVSARSANDGPKLSLDRENARLLESNV